MRASRSPALIVAVPRPSSAQRAEASVVCPLCLAGATAYAAPGACPVDPSADRTATIVCLHIIFSS